VTEELEKSGFLDTSICSDYQAQVQQEKEEMKNQHGGGKQPAIKF